MAVFFTAVPVAGLDLEKPLVTVSQRRKPSSSRRVGAGIRVAQDFPASRTGTAPAALPSGHGSRHFAGLNSFRRPPGRRQMARFFGPPRLAVNSGTQRGVCKSNSLVESTFPNGRFCAWRCIRGRRMPRIGLRQPVHEVSSRAACIITKRWRAPSPRIGEPAWILSWTFPGAKRICAGLARTSP